jgi:hypothetical protein
MTTFETFHLKRLHLITNKMINENKIHCLNISNASDKVYQLLPYGRWFSPSIAASLTTKTGRHDIAKILLKVALKHQK